MFLTFALVLALAGVLPAQSGDSLSGTVYVFGVTFGCAVAGLILAERMRRVTKPQPGEQRGPFPVVGLLVLAALATALLVSLLDALDGMWSGYVVEPAAVAWWYGLCSAAGAVLGLLVAENAPLGTDEGPEGAPASRRWLAIASLVLGVLSLPLFRFVVVGVAALVCGLLVLRGRPWGERSNLAVAGTVLGAVSLVVLLPHNLDWPRSGDKWVRRPIAQLDVGDCLKGKVADERVDIVSCERLHHGEVVGVLGYQAGPGAPYPGRSALRSNGSKGCEQPLAAYVDLPPGESWLDVVVFLPIPEEWQSGVRHVLCVATDGGSPLYESVRGSER